MVSRRMRALSTGMPISSVSSTSSRIMRVVAGGKVSRSAALSICSSKLGNWCATFERLYAAK